MAGKSSDVTINIKTVERLIVRMDLMEKALEDLKASVLKVLPVKYGSKLWWSKAISEARESFETGDFSEAKNVKDLIKQLGS